MLTFFPEREIIVRGRQRTQLLYGGCNCSTQCYGELQPKLFLMFFFTGTLFVPLKRFEGYNQEGNLHRGDLLCVKYQFSSFISETRLRNEVMLRRGLPFSPLPFSLETQRQWLVNRTPGLLAVLSFSTATGMQLVMVYCWFHFIFNPKLFPW